MLPGSKSLASARSRSLKSDTKAMSRPTVACSVRTVSLRHASTIHAGAIHADEATNLRYRSSASAHWIQAPYSSKLWSANCRYRLSPSCRPNTCGTTDGLAGISTRMGSCGAVTRASVISVKRSYVKAPRVGCSISFICWPGETIRWSTVGTTNSDGRSFSGRIVLLSWTSAAQSSISVLDGSIGAWLASHG